MQNNYWKDEKLISATHEALKKLLDYEIWMFRKTCDQLNSDQNTRFERNLLLESLPAHIRILIEFFYNDKNKKYPNDLVAQDFLADTIDWKKERPSMTELLNEAKNKADKQLAHLSRWRIKIEKDGKKSWDWQGIKKDMEKVVEKFESLK